MNEHFKRTGPAVEAHYQFLLWLVPTVDRFPKSQKFVFGDRVLNLALDVLEGANEVVESRHFCCDARVSLWSGFRTPGSPVKPQTDAAGVGKAPRHEIAVGVTPGGAAVTMGI
jgi:hypothetical protein